MTEFEIEGSFESAGRGYVTARLVDPSAQFYFADGTTLAGHPVESWVEMPRALDSAGHPRTDVFGFCLKSRGDLSAFRKGDRVELVHE